MVAVQTVPVAVPVVGQVVHVGLAAGQAELVVLVAEQVELVAEPAEFVVPVAELEAQHSPQLSGSRRLGRTLPLLLIYFHIFYRNLP